MCTVGRGASRGGLASDPESTLPPAARTRDVTLSLVLGTRPRELWTPSWTPMGQRVGSQCHVHQAKQESGPGQLWGERRMNLADKSDPGPARHAKATPTAASTRSSAGPERSGQSRSASHTGPGPPLSEPRRESVHSESWFPPLTPRKPAPAPAQDLCCEKSSGLT